jgi:hypothetical protein
MRTHTGEKPFKCDFEGCGLRFRAHSHLKDHRNTHLKMKLYSCKLCERAYGRISTLKEHLKTHNNVNNREWANFVIKRTLVKEEVLFYKLGRG